jgi:hypothetical protein
MITFNQNINLSSSIFIHFIESKLNVSHVRTTTFKRILFGQDSVVIYWSLPFHVAFVELENKIYYLIYMQKIPEQSTLNSFDRCLNIK